MELDKSLAHDCVSVNDDVTTETRRTQRRMKEKVRAEEAKPL
jgi:hypothetical protein